jgi:general secretion pathway protein J
LIRLFTNEDNRNAAGFTLIEVLVVITIIAIVLSSLYGIFASVSGAKDRLDDDSETYHLARVIFDRLGRELHSAYYRSDTDESLFRGGEEDGNFYLEFSTAAVSPLSIEGTGFAIVEYVLEEDDESDSGGLVLMRTEQSMLWANSSDAEPTALRLAPGITSMTARFYGSDQWQDSWDATTSGLPERIELELFVSNSRGVEVPFLTTFSLP